MSTPPTESKDVISRPNLGYLLSVSFNQLGTHFACGFEKGFKVFAIEPFKEFLCRDYGHQGGLGHVEMYNCTNYLALVGGSRNPRYPVNQVIIWDDRSQQVKGQISFKETVHGVRLAENLLVVLLAAKVYLYSFSDLKLVDNIRTSPQAPGLCALTNRGEVIAVPHTITGQVYVERLRPVSLVGPKDYQIIPAHEGKLVCLALNGEGTRLATASEKGTRIRVFSTKNGRKLHEFHRGTHPAVVCALCFNEKGDLLACASNRETIHIYHLEPRDEDYRGASGGTMWPGWITQYLSAECSVAQIKMIDLDPYVTMRFGKEDNSLIVVGSEGGFRKVYFSLEGGKSDKEDVVGSVR